MSNLMSRALSMRAPRAPRHPPLSRLAPPRAGSATGLRFTECLMLLVLAVANFESITQPLFGIQVHLSIFAHLPLVLLGPVLALHLTGMLINRNSLHSQPILQTLWPLVALALYALVGSAIAKWTLGVTESYLAFGVYLLLMPVYATLTAGGERVRQWALGLIAIWLIVSLAAMGGMFGRNEPGLLHETEYLVVTGFLALFYAVRSISLKFLAVVLLLAATIYNQKLTGVIIAIFALVHIVLTGPWRRMPRRWRGFFGFSAAVGTMALVAILALLYFEFRHQLPSGNPEVRLAQYKAAFDQFAESPLWGNAYLAGSGEVWYERSGKGLNIPTHSDVIDLLKHGGVIALGLFAWGYWKVYRLIDRAVAATHHDLRLNAYFMGARFMLLTALFTFGVNPLLLKGPYLLVIWGNFGLAVGMAIGVLRRPHAKAA